MSRSSGLRLSTALRMVSINRRIVDALNLTPRTRRETRMVARLHSQRMWRCSFGLVPRGTASSFWRICRAFLWSFPISSMVRVSSTFRSSVSSSLMSGSLKTITSRAVMTPFRTSSPSARIFWITSGERERAFETARCPRSMRLAISTSLSRVRSATAPISRRYMRTGSLVFSPMPGGSSRSRTSSPSSSFFSNSGLGSSRISMPAPSNPARTSSRSPPPLRSAGSTSLTSS